MPTVDQIAAANFIHNKQQAKQAGALKELASGRKADSIAQALATPFETDELTIPVVQRNIEIASHVLSTSEQALSSVAHNLSAALTTAADAESAPPAAKKVLIDQFNALLDQTRSFVDNAGLNGINLVGRHSASLVVRTTTEGGKLTVAAEQADANSLGVQNVKPSGWASQGDIVNSINQIRNALNRVTSLQSKFAAAQSALTAAGRVNEAAVLAASSSAAALVGANVGAAVLEEKKSLLQLELGIEAHHVIHRHGHKD